MIHHATDLNHLILQIGVNFENSEYEFNIRLTVGSPEFFSFFDFLFIFFSWVCNTMSV